MRALICVALSVLAADCFAQWSGGNVPGFTANFTQVYSPPDQEAIYYSLLSGETGEQGLSVAVGLEGRGGPSWLGKVSPPFKRRRGRVVGS